MYERLLDLLPALPDDLSVMPIRLVHVVDEQTAEDAARLCSLLLRRLPAAEVRQSVVIMGRQPSVLAVPDEVLVSRIGRPLHYGRVLSIARLGRKIEELGADAVFAYSGMAASAADSYESNVSVSAILADPSDAADTSRWLGSGYREPLNAICLSGTMQRRLVEHGVPMQSTSVIHAGVDFAEIRRARETTSRQQLGLPSAGRILVTQSPPSRAGGQYLAVWAAAILHHIWPDAMLVVPGCSREQQRIGRLVETIICPRAYRLTADRYSPAELLAVADAMLAPAIDDAPTGWLPWAMAAGVPIIGSAVPCVTEYITDGHNGFLCKPGEAHTLAILVRTAFESADELSQCTQTARQQAYELFRAERCVDEFLKIIHDMAARHTVQA